MKKLSIVLLAVMLSGCVCESKFGQTNPNDPDQTSVQATCDNTGIGNIINMLNNFGIGFGSEEDRRR